MSAQKLPQGSGDGAAKTMAPDGSTASAALDASVDGDATFAEYDVNAYASEPGGDDVDSKVFRFGVAPAESRAFIERALSEGRHILTRPARALKR